MINVTKALWLNNIEIVKKIRFLNKKGNEIKTIDIFIDAIKPS